MTFPIAIILGCFPAASFAQTTLSNPVVMNAATFVRALPAGGSLGTVFVSGLIGKPGLVTAPSSSPLPYELADVRIDVNDAPAPILAVYIPPAGSSAPGQVNFQMPLERNATGGADTIMFVSQKGAGRVQVALPIGSQTYLSEGFFADANGNVIAQHASDYSQVSAQSPAHPGETIIVYGNDIFPVWPPSPVGVPVPASPLYQMYTGGVRPLPLPAPLYLSNYPTMPAYRSTSVQILFAGLVPGNVAVEQMNIVVPAGVPEGNWVLAFIMDCNPPNPFSMPCPTRLTRPVYLPVR
jgi:uncharacterized protein (TIGR03437 family)